MASNYASTGGAVYAHDDSTVATTDCTITSNFATTGGAVHAFGDSTVTAKDCTMTLNSACRGGAVHAHADATVTLAHSAMTFNSAANHGGALCAEGDSTVTVTDCTMSSNSAGLGGAVILLNSSQCAIIRSWVESNRAKTLGGSIVVRRDSVVNLVNSVFQFNIAANNTAADGVGIVNYGIVQCDVEHCLPCCTGCQDSEPSPRRTSAFTPSWRVMASGGLVGLLVGLLIVKRWRLILQWCEHAVESPEEEGQTTGPLASLLFRARETSLRQPPLTEPDVGDESDGESVELVHASQFLVASYETSSAPIVVVGRSDMGIVVKLWSLGMSNTVPMHVDPVGRPLIDLPFVNVGDACKLQKYIEKTLEAPAEHDTTRACMLHLRTTSGAVLLEMTLNVVIATPEPVIVMKGREVDSRLGCLVAGQDESVVTTSEKIHTSKCTPPGNNNSDGVPSREPTASNEGSIVFTTVPSTSTSPKERTATSSVSLPLFVIEASPAPIFAVDRDARIVSWSPGAHAMRFDSKRPGGMLSPLRAFFVFCAPLIRNVYRCSVDRRSTQSAPWHASLFVC
jgi:hypothetical protein